jgi:hypothetical protein
MKTKRTILIQILVIISMNVIAQNDSISDYSERPNSIFEVCEDLDGDSVLFYYNSRYQLVKPICVEIYRKAKIDTSINFFEGKFVDFKPDSTVILTGFYKNRMKNGDFSFYFQNGQLQSKGKYLNDQKVGIWEYWYDNGLNHQILEFLNGDTLIKEFWDEENIHLVNNGNGTWYTYETSEKFTKIEGDVLNGRKEGKWKRSIADNHFTLNVEKYSAGEFINGNFYSVNNVSEKYKQKIYCVIEPPLPFIKAETFHVNRCYPKTDNNWDYAEYPGGMYFFYEEIKEKFEMPDLAVQYNIKGTIEIQMTINEKGEMTNFKKVSNLGFGLEDELIKVLITMKNWKPTKINGKPTIQTKIIRLTIR